MQRIFFALFALVLGAALTGSGCIKADTPNDGANTCDGYPTCAPGSEEFEACPSGDVCVERTECGMTIFCRSCDVSCPPGLDRIASCAGQENCVTETICGQTIYCGAVYANNPPGTNNPTPCTEEPLCPAGHHPVEACTDGDACLEVTACDKTLLCEPDEDDETCDPDPTCPANSTRVTECPNPFLCDRLESCDGYVYCEYPNDDCTEVPTCDDFDPVVDSCPAGATCYDREACDQTITCMSEGPTLCGGLYGCPDGYSVANPCEPWGECLIIFACGEELECGGSNYGDGCGAPSTCPSGWNQVADCTSGEDVCMLAERCNNLVDCIPE